jgi:hypothetical protein
MKDAEALAKIVATEPRCAGFQKLWRLRMPMPDEAQKAWLFGGDLDSTFTVAAVSEYHPPFLLPAAEWDTARKSHREREHDVLMLYVGWLIWSRRDEAPPSASMFRVAEQAARRAAKHPQAASVQVVDVIHVKGFGGTHVTVKRTMQNGHVTFVNRSGRETSPSSVTLAANAEHPSWRFLALEFLPRRPFRAIGWPSD